MALVIFAGVRGYLDGLAVNQVKAFEEGVLSLVRSEHKDILDDIREKRELTKDVEERLKALLDKFVKNFA